MARDADKEPLKQISRRQFVKSSALAGAALSLGGKAGPLVGKRPRVVRVHDQNATSWDYHSNYYFDYVDQQAVDRMLLKGIQTLMGSPSKSVMLDGLLRGYRRGHKVAIKINCNNRSDRSNEIDATAPVINAVLKGLIAYLGVPERSIYVYDTSREIYTFRIRDRVLWDVNFVESGDDLAQADYDAPISFRMIGDQYCPKVLTQADHLINLPLFKDHLFVLSTMGMKNHFGTTRPGPSYLHSPINENLADLNATHHIRDKTRLVVGDALFGVYTGGPYGVPQQWQTFPDGPTPNSLFLGVDPVAIESVMVDYLIAEQEHHGITLLSHDYLHDAMDVHGLGIHEHRDEQGNYAAINYLEIDLT